MDIVGSLLIALVVPLAWGLGSAWAFDRLRERRNGSKRANEALEPGIKS